MADDESKDLNPGWLFLVIAVVTFLVVLYLQSAPKPPVTSSGAVAQGTEESKKAAPSASEVEPPKALGTEEIARRCDSAIGILKGRHASGTGFLVAPGLLATNSHVVSLERIENIRVTFPAARRGPLTAELIFEDPHRDLALLTVPTDLSPLEIDPSYQFRRGQEMTVIGNPGIGNKLVLENAVSRGVMSTTAVIEGQSFYQLSIAINPGNSGGPVIDSTGRVIGVATLKAARLEATAFCIPANDLLLAIGQVKFGHLETATTTLMHRARYVVDGLDGIGRVYSVLLGEAVTGMDRALAQGIDPNLGIGLARQEMTQTLPKLQAFITDDLYPEMNRVANDERLSASIRDGLVNVWSICMMMKASIEDPKGNTDTYRASASVLRDQHRRLIERLRADLNFPGPEGGVKLPIF